MECITSGGGKQINDLTPFPPTYLVLRFAPGLELQALRWLVDKIRGKREAGGGELLLRQQPGTTPRESCMLHISATPEKLQQAALELDLRKLGQEEPLTPSERQFVVQHELLQGIRALPEDTHIPGHPDASLYHGQSIVEVFHQQGLLECMYPLHNKEDLRRLRRRWYCTLFQQQPLEEIRGYFGDAIALYFCFLGFYTTALLLPMTVGLLQLWLADKDSALPAISSVINAFWVILFLVLWKRRSNELAYSWGTIKMTGLDEPRASFRGVMRVDQVTDLLQPQYPRWKTYVKMYTVSWPIALVCASVAFYVMLASFWAEQIIIEWGTLQEDGTQSEIDNVTMATSLIPSIIYTALVWLMNRYYRRLATWLTEWENHRTQSQFDRHRVLKLVVFEFVNNFMALFYIAFVYQDMEMLRYQIAIMLILLQFLNHFQEAIIPYFILKYTRKVSRSMRKQKDKKSETESSSEDESTPLESGSVRHRAKRQNSLKLVKGKKSKLHIGLDVPELDPDDPRVIQALEESDQEEYESTYDDYLEMFIQFGYVILFSPVYPEAALCAVVNNILEVRADAFKLCRVTQRPLPRRVKDIGAWQRAFEAVGIISVGTNCAILALMPCMREAVAPSATEMQWILMIGALEHALLMLGMLLYLAVPPQPEWVRVALARQHHQSQHALRCTS